jgi:hypothetical protein
MRFLIDCIDDSMLSWMRDLPVDLYPGALPSVQIRGNPATDPLIRGISQQLLMRNPLPIKVSIIESDFLIQKVIRNDGIMV